MDALKEYKIPFVGLSTGIHIYSFELDGTFFNSFEYGEIEDAVIQAEVSLDKQSNMMVLDFHLEGKVDSFCDRCNDPMVVNIDTDQQLIVKFGAKSNFDEDEVIVLGPSEFEIDISNFLYEYAHLALPSKKVHEDIENCNQTAVDFLENQDFDEDDDEDIDPRWNALKDIKE